MARSKFDEDYKNIINNILRNIYQNTEYWGVGEAGNEGIIRPITPEDNPTWSNYNFINTHRILRNEVIMPYMGSIDPSLVRNLDYNAKYNENTNNAEFFRVLWIEKDNIFGPNSSLKNEIISRINRTRKAGDSTENFTKMALESIPGFTVEKIAQAGGTSDFIGIDLVINSTSILPKNKSTAQVKPFSNITKNKNYWYIKPSFDREYTTDLLIFTRREGIKIHVAVFSNDPKRIIVEPDRIIIPSDLGKLLINYNYMTGKSTYSTY